ncbi:Mpo1-like protein [Aliikangiella sp. IMCC44653]
MQIYTSFEEFWPYYLAEHRKKKSRLLHYFGTLASCVMLIGAIITQAWHLLPVVLIVGYLPAWVGHFFIEKNRPATFKHPLWSLRGDFRMLKLALLGQLEQQLASLD